MELNFFYKTYHKHYSPLATVTVGYLTTEALRDADISTHVGLGLSMLRVQCTLGLQNKYYLIKSIRQCVTSSLVHGAALARMTIIEHVNSRNDE